MSVVPNHVEVFTEKYSNLILTYFFLLKMLTIYETTYSHMGRFNEQLYLDYLKPKLNGSLLANWATYNKGSTANIRSKKERLSLSFLNRSFSEKTKELHKIHNTGKILSANVKLKISKGSGGLPSL